MASPTASSGRTSTGSARRRRAASWRWSSTTAPWEPCEVTAWCYWNTLMGDPATDAVDRACRGTSRSPIRRPSRGGERRHRAGAGLRRAPGRGGLGLSLGAASPARSTVIGGNTDADGRVDLPIYATTAGEVLVTVTGHNLYAVPGELSAFAGEPDFVGFGIACSTTTARRRARATATASVNPGETIVPQIHLSNYGTDSAPAVTLTLGCDDPLRRDPRRRVRSLRRHRAGADDRVARVGSLRGRARNAERARRLVRPDGAIGRERVAVGDLAAGGGAELATSATRSPAAARCSIRARRAR